MKATSEIPKIPFESQKRWEDWLRDNHDKSKGIWLMIAKKGTGIPSVTYSEALEVVLAYGWIDSQALSYDHRYYLQKFTRRGRKSVWSKTNRDKAIGLIRSGKMKPSGMQQVELAKASGEWRKAYEPQSQMTVPDDFQEELDKNEGAKDFFSTSSSTNRYAILFRIQSAKGVETRQARIKRFIEMLSRKEKLYRHPVPVRDPRLRR